MRIPILLFTATLVLLSLVTGDSHTVSANYSCGSLAALLPLEQPGHGTPSFSSLYTNLTKCGSGLTKKEAQEAEEHGTDIPTKCKAFGGYSVYIYYSACTAEISLERGQETIHLATQAGDFKQKTVEWRMAKGKPFAVIMRVYEYSGDDLCAVGGKVTGESLIVKGLKGYERIDAEVKVKGTANPNEKAREIADKGYR